MEFCLLNITCNKNVVEFVCCKEKLQCSKLSLLWLWKDGNWMDRRLIWSIELLFVDIIYIAYGSLIFDVFLGLFCIFVVWLKEGRWDWLILPVFFLLFLSCFVVFFWNFCLIFLNCGERILFLVFFVSFRIGGVGRVERVFCWIGGVGRERDALYGVVVLSDVLYCNRIWFNIGIVCTVVSIVLLFVLEKNVITA